MSAVAKAPFYIAKFSIECFSLLVRECFGESFPNVSEKDQVKYLCDYLNALDVETIVCETDYVDRGYLEDFSSYYVSCFGNYPSHCARFHFFSTDFGHSDFQSLLTSSDLQRGLALTEFPAPRRPGVKGLLENPTKQTFHRVFDLKSLQSSYRGFIVVKPLPKTFIGRTCLSPYESFTYSPQKRVLTRGCHANLFGIPLTVESVAFQEQDKVISACVTSALWSLMHALTQVTRRRIPSPSEITISAKPDSQALTNSFPIAGLDDREIVRALDHFRLKHHGFRLEFQNKRSLLEYLDVYINSDHPLLLGGLVFERTENGGCKYKGDHAVAILGYKKCLETGLISQLYMHDDRWGPYMSATIDEDPATLDQMLDAAKGVGDYEKVSGGHASEEEGTWKYFLRLGKKREAGDYADIRDLMVPTSLIVPTYRKVRVSARPVLDTTILLTEIFQGRTEDVGVDQVEPQPVGQNNSLIDWEVRLRRSNSVREDIRSGASVVNKKEVLLTHMPRYVWAATATTSDGPLFTIFFDATDIPQGRAFVCCALYREEENNPLLSVFRNRDPKKHSDQTSDEAPNFVRQFIEGLKQEEHPLWKDLDQRFGELRAPDSIKKGEVRGGDLTVDSSVEEYFSQVSAQAKLSKWLEELRRSGVDLSDFRVIWAISAYGSLLIGQDRDDAGHPTLTGAKSARIAGEIRYSVQAGGYLVDAKSGRYSSKYSREDRNQYLESAVTKFREIFPDSTFLPLKQH